MIVVEASTVAPVLMDPKDDPIVGAAPVSVQRLLSPADTDVWGAGLTTFGIGGRLRWHTHDSEQIIYVTEGRGIVATEEKECIVTPGAIVFIRAGEKHWHGATPDSSMTHINIQKSGIHLAE